MIDQEGCIILALQNLCEGARPDNFAKIIADFRFFVKGEIVTEKHSCLLINYS